MSKKNLYRAEAINAKHIDWLGEIVLLRPPSFAMLSSVAAVFALMVIVFFAFGSYTTRAVVVGQLVPVGGLYKVYSSQPGVVVAKKVVEGQRVKKGQVLFMLSSERQSASQVPIQTSIIEQVNVRRRSLMEEREKTRLLHRDEKIALQAKVGKLQQELSSLDSQISAVSRRVKLSKETFTRYQALVAQHYVSQAQAQQREEETLDQEIRLQTLQRDRITIEREFLDQETALKALSAKQENQIALIDRSLASIDEQLAESESRRGIVVTAPEDGTVTAIAAEIGQWVDANRPLLQIVPAGGMLEAHLYAPSRAVGFIKPGMLVQLRYKAFPYQKFGHADGIVLSVSDTSLAPAELTELGAVQSALTSNGEPVYRIIVRVPNRAVRAYGRFERLRAGMILDADILEETRRFTSGFWILYLA